ncbi:hypothetical protein WMF37_39760 [Sorangium sp. So ce291]|uniref:hypothetical protein n=1 Tax=Sorangium sp. So ce291 TaxID=3133294 RepID=UPI003F612FDE
MGSIVLADRERRVVDVERDNERGEVVVYLREDAEDLAMQVDPTAHLTHIEIMKTEGWDVEGGAELRALLRERIAQQDGGGPAAQN